MRLMRAWRAGGSRSSRIANDSGAIGPLAAERLQNVNKLSLTILPDVWIALSAAAIGTICGLGSAAQKREGAEKKIVDLNCDTIEAAMKMIEGSARSMGLQVVEG